jgi:hypothetical protein
MANFKVSLPQLVSGVSPTPVSSALGRLRRRFAADAIAGINAVATAWPADDHVRPPMAGDDERGVPADTVRVLIELARDSRRADFLFLAGSAGVKEPERFWQRTRRWLGLSN